MAKVGLFYTAWTDSVERIVDEAAGQIIPIHYSQIIWQKKNRQLVALANGQDLAQFRLFYFRAVGDRNENLPLLLEYAQKRQIRVVDQYLTRLGGAMRKRKSNEAMLLQAAGVSYPKSVFVADHQLLAKLVAKWPKPVILKNTAGRHGTGTFWIRRQEDLEKAFLGRRRANFLLQEYIPNDGDYRLFLIGYQVVAGFKRQPKEAKLILNRSQGSSVALEKVPVKVKAEAEKAARALGVEIAGVDLVVDQRRQQPVVIEVNQAPEFRVMEKRTGKNIAAAIIQFLLK